MLFKILGIMLVGIVITAFGNLMIAKGMRAADTSFNKFSDIFRIIKEVVSSGPILTGGILLVLSFAVWLWVLSMADLSLILPLTALDYIMNAFLAKAYLKEHVSAARWAGTLIIFLGVLVVICGDMQV